MQAVVVTLTLLVATGCRYTATYTCETNDQCRSRTEPGTCQLPEGLCSFPDPVCPAGQRYDDTAGELAGGCVEAPAMVDAGVTFDPNQCPAGFSQLWIDSTSRYRVLPALPLTATFSEYATACDMQKVGYTHAAVIDTAAEAMALAQVLNAPGTATGQVYIGVVQDPAAVKPNNGWIHADGSPVIPGLWAGGEPNDGNGSEADHKENVAVLKPQGPFNDITMPMSFPVLCECDGHGPAAMFTAFAAASGR